MLAYAVTVLLGHVRVGTVVRPLWRPGEVIPTDLDVVVSKLAELVVVHAEQLCFLRSPQVKTGDEVDEVGEDGAHDKRVSCTGKDVGELDVELAIVADRPPADTRSSRRVGGSGVDPIQTDDVVDAKERIEHETDHAGETVFSEHIHGVVDSDPVLD